MTRGNDNRRKDAATLTALFLLFVCGAGLLGLVALVMPQALGLVIVVGAFLGFGAFHYLLWGWWMPRLQPPDDEDL